MSKPKEISIQNKGYFAWPYEEQTQIKHKVLGLYYKIYASKLGVNSDILFVDCHGGCGAYINKDSLVSYGSSVIVNDVCTSVFLKRKTKSFIIICERDRHNYDNLNKVISELKINNIKTYNNDYNSVLTQPRLCSFYKKHPTLFFIDPFGYYDTPMANMSDLMSSFGNEILINFMFDFLNRGISVSSVDEAQLTSFFGSAEWKKARLKSGTERESFLVNLYKERLKATTNAKFVFAYRLCYPTKNQTYYYLIHATNHIDGINNMKNSFASINNGRVEYLGRKNNDISLFDMDSFKQEELSCFLKEKFNGESITFDELLESIVEDTATIEKDLRSTVKTMEQNGSVFIQRISSAKTGLKGKDKIIFKVISNANDKTKDNVI